MSKIHIFNIMHAHETNETMLLQQKRIESHCIASSRVFRLLFRLAAADILLISSVSIYFRLRFTKIHFVVASAIVMASTRATICDIELYVEQ